MAEPKTGSNEDERDPVRLAVVILVDARGWLLLQERDSGASVAPDCWSLCGGHVEPGETDEQAVHRELAEETGLTGQPLRHWRTFEMGAGAGPDGRFVDGRDRPSRFAVWVAPTDAVDADIVLGEGRQIVFVDPAEVPDLTTSESGGLILEAFLGEQLHVRLAQEAGA